MISVTATDPRIKAITINSDGDVVVDSRPFENQHQAEALLLWASSSYRDALRSAHDDVPEALAEVRAQAEQWLECYERRLRRRGLARDLQKRQRDAARQALCGEFVRASGDVPCLVCGAENREHPQVEGYGWLTLLCDGSLVKL